MRDVAQPFDRLQPALSRSRPLVVGLVNNMPDGALKATEEQFARLLRAACPHRRISLELFSCRSVRRRGNDACIALRSYRDVTELFSMQLDAVIVTGMEPQAADVQDEPAWSCLTRLADWAQETAVPVIWSCLAAHAVVFYLDGIRRARLPAKLCGVFDCELADPNHPLATDLPDRWSTPHSRHNGLPEEALAGAGYEILSRSDEAGVDSFLKPGPAPHIFFQGHPEYDTGTLLSEYTRDVRRYLAGQRDEYPLVPRHYLDAPLEAALDDYRSYVLRGHRDLGELKAVLELVVDASRPDSWHRPAVRLYANWIDRLVPDTSDHHLAALATGFHCIRLADPVNVGEC